MVEIVEPLILDDYQGREQTLFKHYVLKEYLCTLAMKVGMAYVKHLNYVDCFAGPWESECESFSDTSPKIAINELLKAKEALTKKNRDVNMGFVFIERSRSAYENLLQILSPYIDTHDVESFNDQFVNRITEIQNFINRRQPNSFTFFFIDPTGWTGFGMDQIQNLLRRNSGEVLINLMTKDIKRFIEEEVNKPSFIELFGQERIDTILERVRGLTGIQKEEVIVEEYCNCLRDFAGYDYIASAVIVNPEERRNHFHLIYGTRNLVGLDVFTKIEDKLIEQQKLGRALIKDQKVNKEVDGTLQTSLFSSLERAEINGDGGYIDELREHYLKAARSKIQTFLSQKGTVVYDDLFAYALQLPMVSEKTLKQCLTEWEKEGKLRYDGFVNQRVPKIKNNNSVIWN